MAVWGRGSISIWRPGFTSPALDRRLKAFERHDGDPAAFSAFDAAAFSSFAMADFSSTMYVNAVKSDIRKALVNQKANSCPMAVRLAWHAAGTYSKHDDTGGSDGATMRFPPERDDGANRGLGIERDVLQEVKRLHPHLSYADIWTLAGAHAIEIAGGPAIDHKPGRSDAQDGSACPMVGRLPDATQGAAHLRDVFYREYFACTRRPAYKCHPSPPWPDLCNAQPADCPLTTASRTQRRHGLRRRGHCGALRCPHAWALPQGGVDACGGGEGAGLRR